jgi:hypothetical protein
VLESHWLWALITGCNCKEVPINRIRARYYSSRNPRPVTVYVLIFSSRERKQFCRLQIQCNILMKIIWFSVLPLGCGLSKMLRLFNWPNIVSINTSDPPRYAKCPKDSYSIRNRLFFNSVVSTKRELFGPVTFKSFICFSYFIKYLFKYK